MSGRKGENKNARPVPLDGEAQCAVPLSCFARKASIAAKTEGITPPAPGRTFSAPPGGPFAAGGGPSLSFWRRYSFRSLRLCFYYIISAEERCQGNFINVSGVFIAMGQAVCYNETNIDLRRRTMIWTESFWRSR